MVLRAYTRGAQLDGYLRERGRGDSEPPRTPRWRPWERAPDVLKVAERGSSLSVERRAAQCVAAAAQWRAPASCCSPSPAHRMAALQARVASRATRSRQAPSCAEHLRAQCSARGSAPVERCASSLWAAVTRDAPRSAAQHAAGVAHRLGEALLARLTVLARHCGLSSP